MTTLHLSETFNIMERYISFGNVRKDIKLAIIQEVCATYNQQVVAFEMDDDGVEWYTLSPGISITNQNEKEVFDATNKLIAHRYGITKSITLPIED